MKSEWNVISPKRRFFDINIREYWQYRDLYFIYIKRDLIAAYKQTILGPLWYIIQPLITMAFYMFLFGDLAKIPTDGIPQPIFYFSGIMLWNYFSASFSYSSDIFTSNVSVFSKVYFPRLIIPLSALTSNLVKLGIQVLFFILIYIWFVLQGYSFNISWTLALFPFLIIILAMYSLSWGLIISCITYKYRDLRQLVNYGIQLFMYITPVVYPLNATPSAFKIFIELNPITPVFEIFRYSVTGCGNISWWTLAYSYGLLFITLVISVSLFNKTEKTFMDTV